MDADVSQPLVERPEVRAPEALSDVRSSPKGFQEHSRSTQGLSFTLSLIALARAVPAGRQAASVNTLVERDQRLALVADDAGFLSAGPSAPRWAGVLAVLGLLCIAVAVWAIGAGAPAVPAQHSPLSLASTLDVSNFETLEPHPLLPGTSSYAPGQSSGWHRHPGLHLVTVMSGTLTVYERDCTAATYGAGQEYVGGEEPHLARNETEVTLEMTVTYLPRSGHTLEGFRVNEPSPPTCAVE